MKTLENHALLSCCIPRGLGWSSWCETQTIFSTWAVHSSQSRAAMSTPLDLWQGSRAGWHRGGSRCSPLELCCWWQTSRTCARLLWWLTSPSPRAAPASGRNCPPADLPSRKGAKLDAALTWLVECQGRLQSCLKASLCRHNKGQLSPFQSQSCHGVYLCLKDMRLLLLSGNTIKNILFSSWVLEDMWMWVWETKHRQMWPF